MVRTQTRPTGGVRNPPARPAGGVRNPSEPSGVTRVGVRPVQRPANETLAASQASPQSLAASYVGASPERVAAVQSTATQRPFMAGYGSTNISVNQPDFDQFREFGDSVMQEYQRSTAPEIEARRARLNQDLVNRGITPGSEAYEREMTRFGQMENDLFNTAQRSALAQGLEAQQQQWAQGFGQSQINAGLAQSRMAADASMYGADIGREGALERLLAGLGQQESEFGRTLDEGTRRFDLGFGEDARRYNQGFGEDVRRYNQGFGEDMRRFNAGFGENQRQFDSQFGLASGQADFNNLMSFLGYNLDVSGFNNQAQQTDFSNLANLLGGFLPNAPFVPIDAGGAYDSRLAAQQARTGVRSNNYQTTMEGIGTLGSALIMSDRNIKHDIEPVDNTEQLEALRRVPVSRWKYNGEEREHIGPMAQDFGAEVTGDPDAKEIYAVDAIGTLIASVQALADRVDAMEAR